MGEFGLPRFAFAWCALAVALVWMLAFTRRRWSPCWAFAERHYGASLCVLGALSALLSWGYFEWVLHGGSRIIDATAYYQQAKIFATGHLTSPLFEVGAATRGRFLYVAHPARELGVLFPPGYAALLALGCRFGAPYGVGPVLAALLVISTAELTRRIFRNRAAALAAALLSTTTIGLRYHTADTMSHGFAALLVTLVLIGAVRLGVMRSRGLLAGGLGSTGTTSLRRRTNVTMSSGLFAGGALGWLLATRPITGAVLLFVGALYRWQLGRTSRTQPFWRLRPAQWTFAASCCVGFLPGCALWFAYQWATTGSPFHATQMAYYAVADGPPGCFRYGFGKGIGCLFEHSTYVERRLPNGFGLAQAAYVTLLRLRWHSLDVLNFEPLILLVVAAAVDAARRARARLLVVAVAGVMLGYLPFYFDASYPGGGARLYVDVIPLEHALVAGWLMRKRQGSPALIPTGTVAAGRAWRRFLDVRWVIPMSLIGFAVHGAFEHMKLRDRDGGRPMFESSVLSQAGVRSGLVWVDTDHGFLLGHEPAQRDPRQGIVVARHHGDAHDRVLWESLGRPPAYRYRFDPTAPTASGSIEPVPDVAIAALTRFEAETEWPVLAVERGWVRPVYPPNDCTSGLRGLALEPVEDAEDGVAATLAIHAQTAGPKRIELGLIARASGPQRLQLVIGNSAFVVEKSALAHQCWTTELTNVSLERGEQPMQVEANALGIVLDYWRIAQ